MERLDLVEDYPRPCHEKIPHFKGCGAAGYKLSRTREFRKASTVKVNPSLAQMPVRRHILSQGKVLLVPSPALGQEFFYLVDPSTWTTKSRSKVYQAASKKGSAKLGVPLNEDWSSVNQIDLLVVASVAVCPVTGVRLGKGLGYAELEWGILTELGVVSDSTFVVTTVHDSQLVEMSSKAMMRNHDLPVDMIVTPSTVIRVKERLNKPTCGVLWDEITQEKLSEISVLRKLRTFPCDKFNM